MEKARIGVVIHTRLRERLLSRPDKARLGQLGEVMVTESPKPSMTSRPFSSVALRCALSERICWIASGSILCKGSR